MKSRSLKRSKLVVDAMPHIPDIIGGAAGVADHGGGAGVRFCDGFRMPARHGPHHAHRRAGVRNPSGKEGAGSWAPVSAGAMRIW